jgi:hypothetical protein
MRLTIPGQEGYHPQVGGNDPVSDDGKVADVTDWLLTKLADIHSRANLQDTRATN